MYTPQNFSHLIGLAGFSDALLTNHFTLYEGYVKNTNAVAEKLAVIATDGKFGTPEYNELKRRFGWEWNGMRLHELYFGNMTKTPVHSEESALHQKVVAQFGSAEAWEKEFKATGAMRGIGWVVLAYDRTGDKLFNTWIGEHDIGHLAGAEPLLIMDVFEHAFMLDYGLGRVAYIEAFWKAIDWQVVASRFHS